MSDGLTPPLRVPASAPARVRLNPQNISTLQAARRPANPAGPFADLTWHQQRAAEQWLTKFCKRWGSDLPNWRRAILIGTAKRLALHPPQSGFGRRLQGAWGGNATARKYRALGLPHPRIVAMHAAMAWKKAGRPPLPGRQLPV